MRDPDEALRSLLFGDEMRPVSFTTLSRRTGIPRRTLSNWRRDPTKITVGNLRKLARAQGIPWGEVGEAIGGKR